MTNDLFTSEPDPVVAQSKQAPKMPENSVYIPINRLNLIPVVSTGLIRPARAYNKYYEDVLGIRDDLIPLFMDAPGREIADYCASEGANTFPVILELPTDTFTTDELAAGAVARPVPTARLLAVHCRNDEEVRELLAHTWENASLDTLPVDVLPELFDHEGERLEELRERLMSLPQKDSELFERLSAASRITGGLMAVAGLGEEQKHWAESLMEKGQAQETDPGLDMIQRALLNETPASGEDRLLYGMVHALVKLDFPSRESSEQLLGLYKAQAAEDFPEDARIQKTIERAQHVLIRHDIRPGDDTSAPVSFGLLLHALRSRLAELTPERTDWSTFFEAGQPRLDTLAVARFLTGMRIGRHRLDTADRPPELDGLAADWEAHAAAAPGEPLLACMRRQKAESAVSPQVVQETAQLEPESQTQEQATSSNLLDAPALSHPDQQEETDTPPVPQTESTDTVQIPALDEQTEDFRVAVSTSRGWTDLVAVQVQLSGNTGLELVPGRGSIMSLLLPHDVKVTRIIRDQEQYRLRLEEQPLTLEDLSLVQNLQKPEPAKRRRKTTAAGKEKRGRGKKKDSDLSPTGNTAPVEQEP